MGGDAEFKDGWFVFQDQPQFSMSTEVSDPAWCPRLCAGCRHFPLQYKGMAPVPLFAKQL